MMRKKLAIIGSGGHAVSVLNVAQSAGFDVVCFIDDQKCGIKLLGIDIVSTEQVIGDINLLFSVAIGPNFIREKVFNEYKNKFSLECFPLLIHESAVVSVHTKVGFGTVVMPNVTIGPNSTVGNCCLLNTNSSIDHDCKMEDYSSIAPGVIAGGNVSINERSTISIGTIIKDGITIGSDAVVGASSYVNSNVEDNAVHYGNPSRFVRFREKFDDYLS